MVRALTVAPDGTWFASAGDDKAIRIWEAMAENEPVVIQ